MSMWGILGDAEAILFYLVNAKLHTDNRYNGRPFCFVSE